MFVLVLRWPEPIYMRVGYVFESLLSAGKNMLFIFLSEISAYFSKCNFTKKRRKLRNPKMDFSLALANKPQSL